MFLQNNPTGDVPPELPQKMEETPKLPQKRKYFPPKNLKKERDLQNHPKTWTQSSKTAPKDETFPQNAPKEERAPKTAPEKELFPPKTPKEEKVL